MIPGKHQLAVQADNAASKAVSNPFEVTLADERGFESALTKQQDFVGYHPGLLSGLVFSGANKSDLREDQDDGILTAEEVQNLDLIRFAENSCALGCSF